MLLRESFHHRRSFGAAAVPSPIRSFGTYNKGGKPTFYVAKTLSANLSGCVSLNYAQSVYQHRKLARPPCETFRRNVRGMAGMPPTGGSPDWRIPCVAQRFTPQTVPSVTEHARDCLRRSLCAAYGAENLYSQLKTGSGRSFSRPIRVKNARNPQRIPPLFSLTDWKIPRPSPISSYEYRF